MSSQPEPVGAIYRDEELWLGSNPEPAQKPPRRLYTAAEVSVAAGVPYDTLCWWVRVGAIRPTRKMVCRDQAGCFSRDEVLQAAVMRRLQQWLGGDLPRPLRQAVTKAFKFEPRHRAPWLHITAAGADWNDIPVDASIILNVHVTKIGLEIDRRLLSSDPGRAAKRRDRVKR